MSIGKDDNLLCIYGLVDPRTDKVRYVGKCAHPRDRLRTHVCDRSKTHKGYWIRQLRRLGLKPTLRVLECVFDEKRWPFLERLWIQRLRAEGCRLTNLTDGGDDSPAKSPVVAAKISATLTGRPQPWQRGDQNAMRRPEVAERCAAANRGKKRPQWLRELWSKQRKGKPQPPRTSEHCKHLSEALRGRPHPSTQGENNPAKRAEVRAKISAAKRGRPRPDVAGDKNPAKRPEVRRKIREWWAKQREEKKDAVSSRA